MEAKTTKKSEMLTLDATNAFSQGEMKLYLRALRPVKMVQMTEPGTLKMIGGQQDFVPGDFIAEGPKGGVYAIPKDVHNEIFSEYDPDAIPEIPGYKIGPLNVCRALTVIDGIPTPIIRIKGKCFILIKEEVT